VNGKWLDSLAAVQASLTEHVANAIDSAPRPFHEFLDEDDLAIMAEDRKMEGDLHARGIAEAWQA
jgi:hypothetical protein